MDNKDYVLYEKIKKMTESLSHLSDDTQISFEYIMTNLFPSIYNNILDELKKQYTLGYIAGREDKNNED